MNGEEYVEESIKKKVRGRRFVQFRGIPLEEMVRVMRSAGFVVWGPGG